MAAVRAVAGEAPLTHRGHGLEIVEVRDPGVLNALVAVEDLAARFVSDGGVADLIGGKGARIGARLVGLEITRWSRRARGLHEGLVPLRECFAQQGLEEGSDGL